MMAASGGSIPGRASRLVSRISSSSGHSCASAVSAGSGAGSIAMTRAPDGAAQSTSARVRSPANAPTSTTVRAPDASRQGIKSSASCAIDVPQRSGSLL